MRNIYIFVALFFLISVLIFLSSFIYLDKNLHKIYHYTINLDGHDVGSIKIDKFVTEDKLLYRASSELPFEPLFTGARTRIALDRKYNIDTYERQRHGPRIEEGIYLESRKDALSFVSKFQSKFVCLDDIQAKKSAFLFDDDSPVTYMPIIENYNFRRGRSQGFNAVSFLSNDLPPMKRYVTLTSIRDEYLKIESRKMKTEVLVLKIKNYPQGSVWVAKSDRSIMKIEIPKKNLRITRTFSPKKIEAKEYAPDAEGYSRREISFKSGSGTIAGTFSFPSKTGRIGAVLLVGPSGAGDRNYYGFFRSIAEHLSRNGLCVLTIDKRGTGSSSGDSGSSSYKDEMNDLAAAMEFLTAQKEADPQRIAVIAHSSGAIYAARLIAEKNPVKCLILAAPQIHFGLENVNNADPLRSMASAKKWTNDYLTAVISSMQETAGKVKDTARNWASILGRRCFLKTLREELAEDPADLIKGLKVPVLILQGRADEEDTPEYASAVDRLLKEGANENRILTYYGYLGHFLGKRVNDGTHRIRYEVDKEALENMRKWLCANLDPDKP